MATKMAICDDHHFCMNNALDAAENICAQNGSRLTATRRRVLAMIWENHQPVKAYDLLEKMNGDKNLATAPPTIYRALDFLMEEGLVHRIDSMNAYIGCMHPEQHHDCYFMICQDCGTAEECCNADLARAIATATKAKQFSPHSTTLEILGICQHCRSRSS